jgi:hypothetical protein
MPRNMFDTRSAISSSSPTAEGKRNTAFDVARTELADWVYVGHGGEESRVKLSARWN